VIRNVSQVDYEVPGGARTATASNEVSVVVEPMRSPAAIALLRAVSPPGSFASTAGPTQCVGSAGAVPLPPPRRADGTVLNPLQPIALDAATVVHGGEAVFVRVDDADQNRDAAAIDAIEVEFVAAGGDVERIQLVETGVDTGQFIGHLPTQAAASTPGDCVLQVQRGATLEARYIDRYDANDTAQASALVDPNGRVFDARSGQPLDDVTVRLVTTAGAPAQVFGDDGVSAFPNEIPSGGSVTDASGAVYDFAPGTFRFPLVAPGSYRLEIVPITNYAFPSSVAEPALQTLPGAPYAIIPGSYGVPFDVAGPAPVQVDVPLDPTNAALFLRKSTITAIAAPGDFVQYTLTIENTTSLALPGVTIVDRLPAGVRFEPGSVRIGTAAAPDPAVDAAGTTLTFTLGDLAAGASRTLRYVVAVTAGAHGPELVNTAQASTVSGLESNSAQASVQLREELFRERAIVMGRVVAGDCAQPATALPGLANVRVYLEDGRFAITDEDGKYHFEGVLPGEHVVQVDTLTLPDGHTPQPCLDNPHFAGRGYSQFVDLRGGALWRADFHAMPSGARTMPAPDPAAISSSALAPPRHGIDRAAAAGTPDFALEALAPGIAWLWPGADFNPPIPSLKVAIAHGPKDTVDLTLNGAPVSRLNYDGAAENAAKSVAVSHWRGVDLTDGNNRLVATVRAPDGSVLAELERDVHYSGGATRAEFVPERSTLLADGRSRPTIALRLFDANGKPARPGTTGAYRVDPPYRTWWEVESLQQNPLDAVGNREATFQTGVDGLALIELEPTTRAGYATLRLRLGERRTQEVRAWLEPYAREWIMVGLASGTAAYNTVSGNAQSAVNAGIEDEFDADGRVAFFAKGRIRGDYLLTLAYDSAVDPDVAKRRLFGIIEPDRYYGLYGDATEPLADAASTERLYVKLERRQFTALFGDYETGLTTTVLTRYSRSFTGLRAEYGGERFGFTAFASETDSGFVKDEIFGNGTSGLYRLTARRIVVNSDNIHIEVRDRFNSERIVEFRPLTRYIDYNIDYLDGTLFFKQPVPSRDAAFNPVYIIAKYEAISGGDDELTAGGRARVRFADDRVEVGASIIEQGADAGDARIYGADVSWEIGEHTEVRAELARSESDDPAFAAEANGYLATVRHQSERVEANLFLGELEPGFGTGQQLSTEVGTRKLGVDARVKLAGEWQALAEAFQNRVLTTGAERRYASLEARRETDATMIGVGARAVEDSGLAPETLESQQAFVHGSYTAFDGRMTVRGAAETSFQDRDASSDYPNRYLVGLDYPLRPDVTLYAEYEYTDASDIRSDMTRIGARATPWNRARIDTSLSQEQTELGLRTFSNFGLTQGWQATDRLALDFGVDQSYTIQGPNLYPLVEGRPLASGTLSDNFVAVFAGTLYRTPLWTATSRLEYLDSDAEDRWQWTGGLYREAVRGHAFALGLDVVSSAFPVGADSGHEALQFGWAWRPVASRWIVLDRLDLRHERLGNGGDRVESARIVNNLNANLQLDPRTQIGVQWGLRYVQSTFDGERYSGFSDLYGADVRRTLTPRFDIGLHGTLLNSWESNIRDYAVGFDVGVTPVRNVWVAIGYNFVGFEDDDFSASRHSAQGPYLRFSLKADQDTFRDLADGFMKPR
jgi:uncharacterized repeat protein (TIGR01451 family)